MVDTVKIVWYNALCEMYGEKRGNNMELLEEILNQNNLNKAYKKVVANKGVAGVDGITVEEEFDYLKENKDRIRHIMHEWTAYKSILQSKRRSFGLIFSRRFSAISCSNE